MATGPEVGRDWIHAGDVARGILMLLDHDRPLAPLYHLGTGRNYSMRETIEMIATLVPGTRVRWTDDAREANVVVAANNRRAALGFDLARADFGFAPRFALRDGLRDYLAFLQAMEHEARKGEMTTASSDGNGKFVGIQISPVSFIDESVEPLLDMLKGASASTCSSSARSPGWA